MPDYKKRKRGILTSAPKRKKVEKNTLDADIKMSPSNLKKVNKDMKVVKGRKLENKRRLKVVSLIAAVLLICVLLLEIILPAGIVESAKIGLSLVGTGGYPINLESNETINTVSIGSYYYILSGTHLTSFSSSGKMIFTYPHGFEDPVIKTSASRVLLYTQGGTEMLVFDINKLKLTVNTEKPIITANVSNSGNFAVATFSDKYASAVTVYKKNGSELYEWYSAEDTINTISLSKNGKKLAVGTFKAESGVYKSTLNILNFKSPTPDYTESFENTLIYSLESNFTSKLVVATSNKIKTIGWGNFKSFEYKNDYNTAVFKPSKDGVLAVFNRQSDKTDNRIAVFSPSGKLKFEFNFNGIISDIAVFGNHIYCMSETEILCYDKEGKLLRQTSCGFGGVKINPLSVSTVLVISDNKIEKVKFEE